MTTGRSEYIQAGGHAVCLHPERWQETRDELRAVRDSLKRIEGMVKELSEDHGDLHKRMFVGNGQPSIKAVVDKHDIILSALLWVTGAATSGVIGLIVAMVIQRGKAG